MSKAGVPPKVYDFDSILSYLVPHTCADNEAVSSQLRSLSGRRDLYEECWLRWHSYDLLGHTEPVCPLLIQSNTPTYLAVVFNVNIKCSHCTMDNIYIIILFAISCNNSNVTVITYHHANSYSCKLNPEDRFHRDIFHWTTLADSTNINSTREYLNSFAGSRCLLSSVMQITTTEI